MVNRPGPTSRTRHVAHILRGHPKILAKKTPGSSTSRSHASGGPDRALSVAGRTGTILSVLKPLLAAMCVALGSAAFLNPDPTQLVVLVAAFALVTVVVASSTVLRGTGRLVSRILNGLTWQRSGHSTTEQDRGVVRLVLLAQPRC